MYVYLNPLSEGVVQAEVRVILLCFWARHFSDSQYLFQCNSFFLNGQKLSEKTDKMQGKLVAGLVNHLGEVAMLLIGGLSIICHKNVQIKKIKKKKNTVASVFQRSWVQIS